MKIVLTLSLLVIISCKQNETVEVFSKPKEDTAQIADEHIDTTIENQRIETGNTTPQEILTFAQTLIGTPYKYASTDPVQGFDCSGFITYVFNHFNISVPRTSAGFTNVGRKIETAEAKPGDIILFTGTDSSIRVVGHMGIITSNEDQNIQFIHSTSGKADGVTITPLNDYYKGRFVKIIRVFKQNDNQ